MYLIQVIPVLVLLSISKVNPFAFEIEPFGHLPLIKLLHLIFTSFLPF
jgi:hypothetical protein